MADEAKTEEAILVAAEEEESLPPDPEEYMLALEGVNGLRYWLKKVVKAIEC